ncbi:MAG: response regulator [Nitrospinae bacterium]|nr:response regulator [Nitrospinota bacterium]
MGKKILLADDSVTIQKIIELTFEGEGFDLEVVGDGQEALERAEASPPDIILADFTMPGLSGMELCRRIREHPVLNPVPVVLLTNSFDEFDRSEGDAAGVTAYVEKPFESQSLIDRVHEILSGVDPASIEAPISPEHPAADEVDLISEEPPEEVVPASIKTKRDELLEEFHQATAQSAPSVDAEETLILEEVVEKKTEAPSPTAEEPQSPPVQPDILAPEEKLDEPQAVADEAEQPLDAEHEPPPQEFIPTMDPARAAISHVEEAREPAEPSPAPLSDDATAAAGATLEGAVGDAVRSYIDQLIHQAVEELIPTITQEVVERLEATFPSIAERVIREEVEKLKRGA